LGFSNNIFARKIEKCFEKSYGAVEKKYRTNMPNNFDFNFGFRA